LQNQRFRVEDRKKVPAYTGKILPENSPERCLSVSRWILQVAPLQVPVVAPAGFRSPGVAGPGVVPRRSCQVRGLASPESGTQGAIKVKHNRAELSAVANTCETGRGASVSGGNLQWRAPIELEAHRLAVRGARRIRDSKVLGGASLAVCASSVETWQFPGRFHSRKRER